MGLIAFVIVVITCLVLFVLGLVMPRRSRKAERRINRAVFSGENRSRRLPGRLVPKALRKSLQKSRDLADKSADAGRDIRDKAPF